MLSTCNRVGGDDMYNNKDNQNKKSYRNNLDYKEPIVLELSIKHNLKPKLVAYVRAAIIGEFARYNKETLIEHIKIDNEKRLKAIEEHKVSKVLSAEERERSIKGTQVNIDFRNGVVDFLNTVSDEVLNDILKKETVRPASKRIHY